MLDLELGDLQLVLGGELLPDQDQFRWPVTVLRGSLREQRLMIMQHTTVDDRGMDMGSDMKVQDKRHILLLNGRSVNKEDPLQIKNSQKKIIRPPASTTQSLCVNDNRSRPTSPLERNIEW